MSLDLDRVTLLLKEFTVGFYVWMAIDSKARRMVFFCVPYTIEILISSKRKVFHSVSFANQSVARLFLSP